VKPPLILVVDDERVLAEVLATFLQDEGFRVCMVHDGIAALEQAAVLSPDLIISDMQMPRLGGLGLVRHLRATGNPVPVVLMSSVVADVRLQDVRFLSKPFDLDHLLAVIGTYVPHAGSSND
jgi:CheY-like chemotaxis protein